MAYNCFTPDRKSNRGDAMEGKNSSAMNHRTAFPPVHPPRLFRNRGGNARSDFLYVFFLFFFFNLYACNDTYTLISRKVETRVGDIYYRFPSVRRRRRLE